jgi:proteic killer suppression protein
VDIEFEDKRLALVETAEAHKTKLPFAVIESMRDKLGFLRGAPDERSIRSWRSLHYEKMEGDERSIRLNDQFRLIFAIDTTCNPNKVKILRIWDHD